MFVSLSVKCAGGVFLHSFLSHSDKTRCGRIDLKAASSAAGTLRTVNIYNCVTYLSTRKVEARIYLLVDDYAAADTCTKCDAHSIVGTLSRTCNELTVSRSVSIVLNIAWLVDVCLHQFNNREVQKSQIV